MSEQQNAKIEGRRIDPAAPGRRRGWFSILAVLAVMLLTAPFLLYWRMDVGLFPNAAAGNIERGMTKQEVLVILGEPNQRVDGDDCWNYDRFGRGNDRVCVQFDARGRVAAVSN